MGGLSPLSHPIQHLAFVFNVNGIRTDDPGLAAGIYRLQLRPAVKGTQHLGGWDHFHPHVRHNAVTCVGLKDADLLVRFNSFLFKQRSNVVQSALSLKVKDIPKGTNFSGFPACLLLLTEMREKQGVSLFTSFHYRPRKLCISSRMLLIKTRLMSSEVFEPLLSTVYWFLTSSWRQAWHAWKANSGNDNKSQEWKKWFTCI